MLRSIHGVTKRSIPPAAPAFSTAYRPLAAGVADLTKPQYAVMRSVAEHPGIEQVALIEAAVSTKATLAEMLSRMEARGLVRRSTIRPINAAVLSI